MIVVVVMVVIFTSPRCCCSERMRHARDSISARYSTSYAHQGIDRLINDGVDRGMSLMARRGWRAREDGCGAASSDPSAGLQCYGMPTCLTLNSTFASSTIRTSESAVVTSPITLTNNSFGSKAPRTSAIHERFFVLIYKLQRGNPFLVPEREHPQASTPGEKKGALSGGVPSKSSPRLRSIVRSWKVCATYSYPSLNSPKDHRQTLVLLKKSGC